MKEITVVTVTWNSARLLAGLVDVLSQLAPSCEVLISDNASSDGTPDLVRELLPEAVVLENPVNGGFGYANNRALEMCTTPYVLFLNADAAISLSSLEHLLSELKANPDAAAVQPLIRLWGWPLVTLSAGTALTPFGEGYDLDFMRFQPRPHERTIHVPGVTAAVSLFRRAALEFAGGFDERFFMYFEDTDLCMRLAAKGYTFLLVPSATASHMSGASSTRSEALEWELISTILIARRFLAAEGSRLPEHWMCRERRIRLSRMARGKSSGWRRRAFSKAMTIPIEKVSLPVHVLEQLLEKRPDREPVPRPPKPSGVLDTAGELEAGPGWLPTRILAECAFACIRTPLKTGRAEFLLRSANLAGSVSLWSDEGIMDRTLVSPGAEFLLSCDVRPGDMALYIVPDRIGMGTVLTHAEFIAEVR